MRVWRISNHADLSGRGGELAASRWNRIGIRAVYCSDHPATALLEMLAHIDREDMPSGDKLIAIEAPDTAPRIEIGTDDLPHNWQGDYEFTQGLGADLLNRAEHLLVTVPCMLIPVARNVLINPRHADVGRCSIVDIIESPLDARPIR